MKLRAFPFLGFFSHCALFKRVLCALLIAQVVGCASSVEPRKLYFTPIGKPEVKNLVFPPLSEGAVPRFSYVGELQGDSNFPSGDGKSFGVRDFLGFIVGGAFGESDPRYLSRPQSVFVDSEGRILVSDFARGSILVFSPRDGRLDEWLHADKSMRFQAPVAIAGGPNGSYFVSDADNGFVATLDRTGAPTGTIGRGQLARPTGVAYDELSKRLFVVDTPSHDIKVFDIDGQLLDIWGEHGEEADRSGKGLDDSLLLNRPTHIVVAKGKLYIADTMNARVVVLSTTTGRQLFTLGRRGTYVGNMVRPKGVAVDDEENVYVVESYHDHLLVFNRRGNFLMGIGGEGEAAGEFRLPSGVWIDGGNRIFVADTHNSRVQIFQFLGGDGGLGE